MSCDELYDRLTEHVDGTLQGDICADVEAHLAQCPDCMGLRQDLTDLARLCRQVAVKTAMPEDVRRRIQALLAQDDASAPPRPAV
jgi:RNA polymerase sigma-70 factor (ECF subfamily)